MKMRLMAALMLAVSGPAIAQSAPPAPAAIAPDRAAAAQKAIDAMWPLGTMKRLMNGPLVASSDRALASFLSMKPTDFPMIGAMAGPDKDVTLGQALAKEDPHFRERMKISVDVAMRELAPIADKMEPGIRAGISRIYAREFDVAQLGEIERFYGTSAGKALFEKSLFMYYDPELVKGIVNSAPIPEMMAVLPQLQQKIEAATAHLPKPVKQAMEEDAADAAANAAGEAVDAAADAAKAAGDWQEGWTAAEKAEWSAANDAALEADEKRYAIEDRINKRLKR